MTLLDDVSNHALSKLAASVGISLGNIDEERVHMINIMRRRASDTKRSLCKTKKGSKAEVNKRRK